RNKGETEGTNKSEGMTSSTSTHSSQSTSTERRSGLAIALEKAADDHQDRMLIGLNVGYWEITIAFAARSVKACDIIGGSLIGELSKPSHKRHAPLYYFNGTLSPGQLLFIPR